MVTYLNKKFLFGLLVVLTLIKTFPALSAAASHESETFEVYEDPENTRISRVAIVRHFPTEKEMEVAEEYWKEGKIKVLGKPVYSWMTGIVVRREGIDLSEGLKFLRRAAYYGHPEACSLLIGCFVSGLHGFPKNKILVEAFSASYGQSKSLWEQSERYLSKGEYIPPMEIAPREIWGPIDRAKKDSEERAAVTTSEDIRLHLESKEPEENATVIDTKETNPLLGKDGLHHRYPSYYPGD